MKEKLLKVDGIKVRLSTNELGLWDGFIYPSVNVNTFLLSEWIIRGEADLDKAIDLARLIVPLLRMNYIIMHHDPEGWIRAMDMAPYIEGAKQEWAEFNASESWKGGQPPDRPPQGFGSKRLSDQDPQTRESIRRAATRADTQFPWAGAENLLGYTEAEVKARLR